MEVNKMNNSFTKLGEEEWEECLFNNEPKHEANGECENIVLRADNCSSQNKNWVLYTMFCYEVNRQDRPDTITMKYYKKDIHVMRCAIWYHLHNFKNVKNTHGGVLLLVKLQALAFSHLFCRFFSSSNKNRDETNEKCLRFS